MYSSYYSILFVSRGVVVVRCRSAKVLGTMRYEMDDARHCLSVIKAVSAAYVCVYTTQ